MNTNLEALENQIVKQIQNLKEDIDAIQQPRSDFALEHFVVGMHDTPGRQRMQAVLELQIKMFNIQRAQLEERKLRVNIKQQEEIFTNARKRTLEVELADIEIERIQTDLAEIRLARLGAVREAQALLAILNKLPKYTYEQLQKEEVEYWNLRLTRQAMNDMKSIGTISQGNAEAIAQVFRKLGERQEPLPDEMLESLSLVNPQLRDIR